MKEYTVKSLLNMSPQKVIAKSPKEAAEKIVGQKVVRVPNSGVDDVIVSADEFTTTYLYRALGE